MKYHCTAVEFHRTAMQYKEKKSVLLRIIYLSSILFTATYMIIEKENNLTGKLTVKTFLGYVCRQSV